VARTTRGGVLVTCESESELGLGKERVFGLLEIWEENEREEKEEDKEIIDIIIVVGF
jgi:hypothetical protein